MPQLSGRDEAIVVAVEDLEGLADLLLGVGVLHLARHHRQELGEVDGAVVVGVDLVDHVLQLAFARVLAEGAHHGAQFFGRDLACAGRLAVEMGLVDVFHHTIAVFVLFGCLLVGVRLC
jgi:hypothetical protein